MADTIITATDVITAFGDYYIAQGQNMDNLHQRPFEAFGTKDAFTIIPTNDTLVRESDVELDEILQPYQDAYTPKGAVTFKPVTIELFPMKIDQAFNPSSLRTSWLGFLTSNNTDRSTWPFIRWFIESYLMGKHDEDMEVSAIYNGVAAAPTPGTAGDAVNVLNGVEKIINDFITAGDITPLITGAPSTTPEAWCTQVEEFVQQIPSKYWDKGMQLNMSKELALRYRQGRKDKYNMNYAQIPSNVINAVEDFEAITVVGRRSMYGKSKIWMTPKANARMYVKGYENSQAFELEKEDRKVKIWSDWFAGIGFILPDLIFTNDQDLP